MRHIFFNAILFVTFAATSVAQDVEGSEDHPLITRYPGAAIAWYEVENHMPYRLAVGPVTGYREIGDWIETEGRVTRIYYELVGGQRTHSEVYTNYADALADAGFDLLAQGLFQESSRKTGVGSRNWQEVFFAANPWDDTGAPVDSMARSSATSGGSGSIVAAKDRPAGKVYVAVSVYHFSDETVATLVDIVEEEGVESGLVAVDAEAIGKGIAESGRVVLDGIHFDFDKATLQDRSKAALDQIALYLTEHTDKSFYVVGHTDAKGTLDYNRSLSTQRAQAVVEALAGEYGIDAARLEAHGVGPLAPVFSNESDTGRERNRRVELVER